jgi:hypothetical protein
LAHAESQFSCETPFGFTDKPFKLVHLKYQYATVRLFGQNISRMVCCNESRTYMAVFEAAATGFHGLIETVLKELGYVGRMMLETIQRLRESQPGRYVITTPWRRRLVLATFLIRA